MIHSLRSHDPFFESFSARIISVTFPPSPTPLPSAPAPTPLIINNGDGGDGLLQTGTRLVERGASGRGEGRADVLYAYRRRRAREGFEEVVQRPRRRRPSLGRGGWPNLGGGRYRGPRTLPYSPLPFPPLPCPTLPYPTRPDPTLPDPTLPDPAPPYLPYDT